MTFEMLYSKIHRATVSDANLNYVGSITIDEELMQASNLSVGQKVDVVNINNGERFQTYVIKGEFGKKDMCLNGAAARKVSVGDKIIVIAYATYTLGGAVGHVVFCLQNDDFVLVARQCVGCSGADHTTADDSNIIHYSFPPVSSALARREPGRCAVCTKKERTKTKA